MGVRDFANTTVGQKDNGSSSDYTYWADGSLKSDANKGITNIQYNYLGLPEKIEFGASIRIENTYDAEGMLFSRKFVNGATTTQTDYMGDLIYENGALKTILHDEGIALYSKDTSIITWSDTLKTKKAEPHPLIRYPDRKLKPHNRLRFQFHCGFNNGRSPG
ncbi:MAG: hypothetical protein NXI00_13115 [Cytophagales bacterium]|nr:hypothetical protein [Cytophagales bacterium]